MMFDQEAPQFGAWRLTEGDRFMYAGRKYEALSNPTGEFSTTLNVRDIEKNQETVLRIPDSQRISIVTY